jgi:hypothetical protein
MGDGQLRRIPALASGFESILNTLPAAASRALRNVRLCGYAPTTVRELRLMVDAYLRHHERREQERRRNVGRSDHCGHGGQIDNEEDGIDQRFLIEADLTIKKRWGQIVPEDVREALQALTSKLAPRRAFAPTPHDTAAPAQIRQKATGFEAVVTPLDFTPAAPPLHDLTRTPRALSPIQWEDLAQIANRFDEMDRVAGRQGSGDRAWFGRLYDAQGARRVVLYGTGPSGLAATEVFELSGIRHLIGLPGSGKTTLLYLLAAYLAERGYRACFLFPSIEVSTAFLETLERYNISGALLFGQSGTTRTRHVANFASSLAQQNNGLGVTRRVARFFATNCALEAYASDEDEPFPHSDPPCGSIEQRQGDKARPRATRCALSSVCGRQLSERELTHSPTWVGHILSTDRKVSNLFSSHQINYFELIARTFDLMVIDECDSIQSTLDERGTPLMKLSGYESSVWSRLLEDLHGRAAVGRNAFVSRANMPTMLEMTARFGRAAERLTARVMHSSERFRNTHERMLLTTVSILSDMFDESEGRGALDALERLWDMAAKTVAFRHGLVPEDDAEHDSQEPTDLERLLDEAAAVSGFPVETMRTFYAELLRTVELWDRDGNEAALRAVAKVLKSAPGLVTSHDGPLFFEYTGLLITVSLLVLEHFGLAPHLRLLNAQGLVRDDVFEQRPSRDALALLPETLLGRLSGVRYTLSDDGDVDISHVGFVGTPRLLPKRMHALGLEEGEGPAILLTSATSMLEASPSFHVSVGPHYVLNRPQAGAGWANSQYRFLPQRDPLDERRFLRFSGARLRDRDRILKAIADQLLRGGVLSEVESALTTNDVVQAVGRKAGFVVNSYEQCRLLFDHITSQYPSWRGRVRYLIRGGSHETPPEGALTASEIETLGCDKRWDLLIFPMYAIGRGVNIVYRFGPRIDKAMLGSLYFLTRPHPRTDSLLLMQGLVGRDSERFDTQVFVSPEAALESLRQARQKAALQVLELLRLPLSSQRLAAYARPFVADQMTMILQTIGRAMRGDCPAFVYFVDEAWASASARGEYDDERSSMLVMMRSILNECLNVTDSARRQCYENLYRSFAMPLNHIEGLLTR